PARSATRPCRIWRRPPASPPASPARSTIISTRRADQTRAGGPIVIPAKAGIPLLTFLRGLAFPSRPWRETNLIFCTRRREGRKNKRDSRVRGNDERRLAAQSHPRPSDRPIGI